MEWQIIVLPTAKKHLKAILDQRIQKSIAETIEQLKEEPEQQGKPLSGSLTGYRSIRAFRQRYRIIYKVDTEQRKVLIHVVGIRKEGDRVDVYALARRILRLGLLTLVVVLQIFLLTMMHETGISVPKSLDKHIHTC